jgi:hypothetical protein
MMLPTIIPARVPLRIPSGAGVRVELGEGKKNPAVDGTVKLEVNNTGEAEDWASREELSVSRVDPGLVGAPIVMVSQVLEDSVSQDVPGLT